MSERYWRCRGARPVPRPVPRVVALLAVAGTAAVAGCSSSGTGAAGSGGAGTGSAGTGSAGTGGVTSSAGMAAANLPAGFTAAQLRGALLTKVNGERPAASPETGAYGKLPDVQTSKQSMHGVTVSPARCAQATVTGFNSAAFAGAPASVVTFRVGRDGVSEVIVAAAPVTAARALAARLPAGCAHYHATVQGKTFAYTVKEIPVSGIAEQARALNVRAAGYADVDVWSVVFRADGYVGAVTIVGPDASEQGAKVLAKDAYTRAAGSLH
jgi:hypothetical protein